MLQPHKFPTPSTPVGRAFARLEGVLESLEGVFELERRFLSRNEQFLSVSSNFFVQTLKTRITSCLLGARATILGSVSDTPTPYISKP